VIDRGKHNLLGVRVSAVDYEATVDRVLAAAREGRPLAVTALAVHGVLTGVLDPAHRYRLNHLDLVLPDGQPVRWALNLLYRAGLPDRVYGPTLMLQVCARAAAEGLPIFLHGSTAEVLARLRANLGTRFPRLHVAGVLPSCFRRLSAPEWEQAVKRIRSSGAALTFLGLGCPRQEVCAYELRQAVSMPVIAVGAAFAFHAGMLAQAPPRLQRWGLEWLFRLCTEPRRLWRRYLLFNPLYLTLLLLQMTGWHTLDPGRGLSRPAEAMRFG
jgi:exopolysaccharide biosynthesis WecB/TagA/CpsF family protein